MTEEIRPRIDSTAPNSDWLNDEWRTNQANQFLADIDCNREVVRLLAEGHPHSDIAERTGVELRIVKGTVQKLNSGEEVAQLSPEECGWRRWVGQMSTEEMMIRLKGWPYTFTRIMYYDGTTDGNWGQVESLRWQGYITDAEYDEIEAMAKTLPRYPNAPLPEHP